MRMFWSLNVFPFFRCTGCLTIYALGFLLRWNQIAMFAPVVPIAAFVVTFFVPESPVFLLSKVTVKTYLDLSLMRDVNCLRFEWRMFAKKIALFAFSTFPRKFRLNCRRLIQGFPDLMPNIGYELPQHICFH